MGGMKLGLLAALVFSVALLAAATGASASSPEPTAQATRNCDTRRFVIYAFGGVTCRQARYRVRWMRRHRRGYPGYRCSSGSGFRSGAFCERGRRVFGFHPRD